ncbi:MAG: universal stress protein [Pseudomonadota bacterium]
MKTISKILIAIDFSDYSGPTLRYGLTLAQDVGAEVVVVNVINERDIAAVRAAKVYFEQMSVEDYLEKQHAKRNEMLDRLLAETGCGAVPTEKMIKVGVPAVELLQALKETGADLIVIGTKGRTNVAGMIFGSVAEKLNRRSPVSVLSVRGPRHAELVCELNP